ncbi:MAG: hypothetical protein J6T73_07310, partial [Clostridia bacterium]|nr:hypothetical protein [Clostridia bacterium]
MNITDQARKTKYKIKVIQFGEGNFLRAFVDYMIDIANEKGIFDGDIAIVKPISFGSLDAFYEQNCLYTVVLRGKENGEVINRSRIITSVSKALDCKDDYEEYMALARIDTLRFVVSNTTEAGIVLDENDNFDGLPGTYPGKLTKFLYERYTAFSGDKDKGLFAGSCFFEWGITLTVKPRISPDGLISVEITPTISQLDYDASQDGSGYYSVKSDTSVGLFPIISMKRITT